MEVYPRIANTSEVFPVSIDINMLSKAQLAEFSTWHHIRRLAIFGSILRDDFGPENDIDVLEYV
jgi:predicted nucleotidyltransferase